MRLIVLILTLLPGLAFANDWDVLDQPGAIAIMRHALAPGTGDPSDFDVTDCSTQRNLDDRGRAQARAIGKAFRDPDITFDAVLTSQWCRCRETAALLGLGTPRAEPALNSFFSDFSTRRVSDRGHARPDRRDARAADDCDPPGQYIRPDRAQHPLGRGPGDPEDG